MEDIMPIGYKANGTFSGKVFEKGHKPTHGFKKGHKTWNKETKGIMKPNKTSFKKGCKHPWQDGKISKRGYIYLYVPEHPFATKQGYVRRSRLVMEQTIGRFLKPEEIVHHKGTKYPMSSIENKSDDRPENLRLFENKSAHTKFHHK